MGEAKVTSRDYAEIRAFVRAHVGCGIHGFETYTNALVLKCSCGRVFAQPVNQDHEAELIRLRSILLSETTAFMWPLHDEVTPCAIPFVVGFPASSTREQISVATCVAVQVDYRHGFLLTARHVVEEAISVLDSRPGALCNAGFCLTISANLVHASRADSKEYDVATVPLSPEEIAVLEIAGYRIVRTMTWPPYSALSERDSVIAVGCPGAFRGVMPGKPVPRATKQGVIRHLRAGQFAIHIDAMLRSEWCPPGWNVEMVPKDHLPGMSGGPAFKVRYGAENSVELCGIVKEGLELADSNQILYFASLEGVQADGRVVW